MREVGQRTVGWACVVVLCAMAPARGEVRYPPLSVELSHEHPLFIFENSGPAQTTPTAYAQYVLDAWASLTPALKPFSTMLVDADRTEAHAYYQQFLPPLQAAGLPVVARVASAVPGQRYPLDQLEDLLRAFTMVKGIEITGLQFNEYDLNAQAAGSLLPAVSWLIGAIDIAARYGRFIYLPLDELHWPRIMANVNSARLYEKIRECRNYVIPANLHRGQHVTPRTSALLGLWLEGAVAQWGIAADSRWYTDARFVTPGVFGLPAGPPEVPPSLYRAMVLNGVMGGASVYSFTHDADLWFGTAPHHWKEAIEPTLLEIVQLSLIPRQDFVQRKTPVAYQLAPAMTPQDFHLNLRDIDEVLGRGLLMHGVYGVERAGQIPELILNRNGRFWVPLLSPHAPAEALAAFAQVVQPGSMTDAQQWDELLARHQSFDGEGEAFIAQVMKGIFVLNTRENTLERQTFRLPAVPAPVRGLQVTREEGVTTLTWPSRTEDYSWDVYRRILPETQFERVASVGFSNQPRYVDTLSGVDQPVVYAVRALTDAKEPLEGVLDYGEYLALSTIFSRIAEEVVLSPVLTAGTPQEVPLKTYAPVLTREAPPVDALSPAVPLDPILAAPPRPVPLETWWPVYDNVPVRHLQVAETIVSRIEEWDAALRAKDLETVADMYAHDYEDPQGWRLQYVLRAFKALMDRHSALRMDRQIRRWDFSHFEDAGVVNVLLYCRISAVAASDSSGRFADQVISIPRTESEEIWITWARRDGAWQVIQTNPALPNFGDILSYASGPYDYFPAGPDVLLESLTIPAAP